MGTMLVFGLSVLPGPRVPWGRDLVIKSEILIVEGIIEERQPTEHLQMRNLR
jgi:hypothetical protein